MKHTPGPWYWDSEGLGSKSLLVFGKDYPLEMTSAANKNLIAAAPDLLEALQETAYRLDSLISTGRASDLDVKAAEKARVCISKALGEE